MQSYINGPVVQLVRMPVPSTREGHGFEFSPDPVYDGLFFVRNSSVALIANGRLASEISAKITRFVFCLHSPKSG